MNSPTMRIRLRYTAKITPASKMPKLYIASINDVPVHVGITKRRMSERLRYGWNVTGQHAYHGYAWRRTGTNAVLHVWGDEDQAIERDHLDLETVEAEIVYLIRMNGQWPQFQTEIHFHPSKLCIGKLGPRTPPRGLR